MPTESLPDLQLGPEWALLELVCLGVETPARQALLGDLLKQAHFDWGELLEQAARHKLIWLLTQVLEAANHLHDVPRYIRHLLINALRLNRHELALLRREAAQLLRVFQQAGVPLVATKGIALESSLYAGAGGRHCGDIDFMTLPAQRDRILALMSQRGYQQGHRDWARGLIAPLSRKEQLIYQFSPDHLPKLVRLTGDPLIPVVVTDFAFSFTWTNSEYELALDHAFLHVTAQPIPGEDQELPMFQPPYHFILIVLHFFREAWFVRHWSNNGDVNLIKCADVIRFWMQHPELHTREYGLLIDGYGLTQPVGWVLGHLDRTFGTDMLQVLQVQDQISEPWLASLHTAGTSYTGWSGTMRERLHSRDRMALLREHRP